MFECRALGIDRRQGLPQPSKPGRCSARRQASVVPRHATLARSPGGRPTGGDRSAAPPLGSGQGGRRSVASSASRIGKSRIAESRPAPTRGRAAGRLRYFCSPHHTHSALYPFIAQLERAADFQPGNSDEEKLDKLEVLLQPTVQNAPQCPLTDRRAACGAVGRALPVDESQPAAKTRDDARGALGQLDGIAAQRPVLMVFEDAHWIDPTSLDLLNRTVARVANLPVLLIVTFRPELQPTWLGQQHVTLLALSRLDRRDSAGIIAGVTNGKALPTAVADQILARTDGVPLFIEELTRTLIEGELLRETPDSYVLDGPLPPLAIPTTLQASLVARLDRLATVKDVAQTGRNRARVLPRADRRGVDLGPNGPQQRSSAADGRWSYLAARSTADRDLRVQARSGAGRRLRHDAQELAAAASREHRQSAGRAASDAGREPARGRRPSFHRGGADERGDWILAQGRPACERTIGQPRGR